MLFTFSPNLKQTVTGRNKILWFYKLACNICKLSYVGQTSCSLKQRYQEHMRYMKQLDPQSAYTLHILKNKHEYGPIHTTMSLLKQITKTSLLFHYEQFYIQLHYYHKELTLEENTGENNPSYQLIFDPCIMSPPHYTPISTSFLNLGIEHTLLPTRLLMLIECTVL